MSIIRCDSVSKAYDLQAGKRTLFSALRIATGSATSDKGLFYALSDVSFEVHKGEAVGIVGKNGSGKSTLLKLIAGITRPTSGVIEVNGRISSLIELGAGFHPDLTGRENIMMNASILGLSRKFINEKFDEIVDFAELWNFIDVPVKKYSSGMYARLGFSVAASVEPDIFIVDEALSVGDMFFQAKCMSRIKAMLKTGVTLLFVSHDLGAVKTLCKKAVLLDGGKVVDFNTADIVAEKYFSMKVRSEQSVLEKATDAKQSARSSRSTGTIKGKTFSNTERFNKTASFERIRNGQAEFINVQLLDEDEDPIEYVEFGQMVILRMAIEVYKDLPVLSYGYHIRDKNGVDVIYSSAGIENKRLLDPKRGERYVIDWRFKMSLMQGNYNIVCVMSVPLDDQIGKVEFCDFVPIAAQFQVGQRQPISLYGLVHWSNTIEVEKV